MSRIKIKHFGPIKEGLKENDGWIDIDKTTIFMGNQGSGKSTIAKLISTFTWIEKAYIRGDIETPNIDFMELLEFHRLENYLESNTEIEYEGNTYYLALHQQGSIKKIEAKKLNNKTIKQPKIMYVPAERNFLSSISNINKISDLIIGSLKNYSIEFRNAQLAHNNKSVQLPVNNTSIVYESKTDENYIVFNNKKLKLTEASSGFHSIVPLYWVTKYLIKYLKRSEKELLKTLSTDQIIRRNHELNSLKINENDEKKLRVAEKRINQKYICKYLVNIVEEPEQNLFPISQQQMLNSLMEFNNYNEANKLIITTHSPYLINHIGLLVKAGNLYESGKYDKEAIEKIIPEKSAIKKQKVAIYQMNLDGSIEKLGNHNGIPEDDDFLNEELAKANDDFSDLLDIQQKATYGN